MTVPLRHFLVGFGLLLGGVVLGGLDAVGLAPGSGTLAHVHLLLAGWVCVTIMGAMTQFVPVWSGVDLHSRRLSVVEVWLVGVGVTGFAATLLWGSPAWLPAFGALMLVGFWTFVYNVGRTLATARPWDVTERHFALALAFLLVVTLLGLLLAVDLTDPIFGGVGVTHADVLLAHATLAVFGVVLTTVLGALYQLGPMFTQTDLHGVDTALRRGEEAGYPVGVLALAAGRLVGSAPLARVGGVLVAACLLAFAAILARRLAETRVEWTPMLSRYAVAAPAMAAWAVFAGRAWFADPLSPAALFGGPGSVHLLVVGVVGFVVLGTLYHVVPFIVWVHRYSDRLGYERVPMIDDLYDARLAWVDLVAFVAGLLLLVASDWSLLAGPAPEAGGVLVSVGTCVFVWNVGRVVHDHGPRGLRGVLLGRRTPRAAPESDD